MARPLMQKDLQSLRVSVVLSIERLLPSGQGLMEKLRDLKTLKKCIKSAKVEGRNWRKELQAILHNYHTTPHATTGFDPAVLLLKRPVRKISH